MKRHVELNPVWDLESVEVLQDMSDVDIKLDVLHAVAEDME